MGTKQFDVGNAPVDTQRVDQDDIGDSDFDGSVPMEGSNDDSPIYGAIDILQKHIESLGKTMKTTGPQPAMRSKRQLLAECKKVCRIQTEIQDRHCMSETTRRLQTLGRKSTSVLRT